MWLIKQTKRCRTLQNVTERCKTLQNVTKRYKTIEIFRNLTVPFNIATKRDKTLQNVTKRYKTLQHVTKRYKTLQSDWNLTKHYKTITIDSGGDKSRKFEINYMHFESRRPPLSSRIRNSARNSTHQVRAPLLAKANGRWVYQVPGRS